ncbi:glyoxalase [Nocardia sp. NPDC004604]|uniref:glyoxalase n=1 Tax=Nocardia sp. NPDC004604 TaxID=3157013 RepID=UPI0033A28383
MTDTAVPVLRSGDLTETLDFYRTLGYKVTHEQTRPYAYGAVEANGCAVHFAAAPAGTELPAEQVGCLIMLDDVAERHRTFTAALRKRYGKIPAKGCPRITRFRAGQSRFSVVDPIGNTIIYIQRDEPEELEYGGSRALEGLARVVDNARILRDFKNDDATAIRVLEVGLGRFGAQASTLDKARALATLAELAIATGDAERAATARAELNAIALSDTERAVVAADLSAATDLTDWLAETD